VIGDRGGVEGGVRKIVEIWGGDGSLLMHLRCKEQGYFCQFSFSIKLSLNALITSNSLIFQNAFWVGLEAIPGKLIQAELIRAKLIRAKLIRAKLIQVELIRAELLMVKLIGENGVERFRVS